MTSDSPISSFNPASESGFIDCDLQVRVKSDGDKILLILPNVTANAKVTDWSEVWESLQSRVIGNERSWQKGTIVHLIAKDQLLDARQLQMIEETLSEVDLQLKKVITSRRQTAVASVMAGYSVEQESPDEHLTAEVKPLAVQSLAEPLYHYSTVRSGSEIRHQGTVIILGDVNPGGIIQAVGDILIWGRLRGIAHAGYQGNRQSRIFALKMQPTQLRIANAIARPPEAPLEDYEPEVAYISTEGIRISPSDGFDKRFSYSPDLEGWAED